MGDLKRRILAVVAALLLFAAAGCGLLDQTADANKAIDAANKQIGRYTESGAALEKLMSEAEALQMDPASAKQGIELTDEMTAKLEEQRSAAAGAKRELSKISAMRVRSEFKAYAEKEIAVTDTLLKEDPVAKLLIADLRKVYELVGSGKATQAEIDDVSERIDEQTKKLTELEDRAGKQEQEAAKYFESQKLGG